MAHNRSMGILVAKKAYKKYDDIWVAVNDGFLRHSWILLVNNPTCGQNIVIHGNLYIFLYIPYSYGIFHRYELA